MQKQKIYLTATMIVVGLFMTNTVHAQSKAYSRKKATEAKVVGPVDPKAATAVSKDGAAKVEGNDAGTAATKGNEKLDIQELEQKYWAPKDTDFSVVQNRTYTKAKRWAVSGMLGMLVNDPFNDGSTYGLNVNYYTEERYGYEFMYQKSDLTDSKATHDFRNFAAGVRPNFNRDKEFYGLGFNYVPFYAKMSFLGKKIIYFDMQITPFVGMTKVEQLTEAGSHDTTAFSYGFDITQYFFFSDHFAVRANLHNRFYKSDVLAYHGVGAVNAGDVVRANDSTNTTMFLLGLTYFF